MREEGGGEGGGNEERGKEPLVVNLAAFEIILLTICERRWGSPKIKMMRGDGGGGRRREYKREMERGGKEK